VTAGGKRADRSAAAIEIHQSAAGADMKDRQSMTRPLDNSSTAHGPRPRRTWWPEGYFLAHDGEPIRYVETGAGPPVLLLHGAGGSAVGSWFSNGIAPRLARTNHVVALDMRGHGLSGGRAFDFNGMARDAIAFMDRRGWDRAHVAGYSMGGAVMARLMAAHPERFLTASFQGSGLSETGYWRARMPPDEAGEDPDEKRAQAIAKARRAAKGQEVGNELDSAVANFTLRLMGKRAALALEDMLWRMMTHGSRIDLSRILFPVMAINGQYDRPIARTHRLARELPNFVSVVLPGKGHLTAMMEGFIPADYVEAYASFVIQHNPSRSG
jgi:pimeloyl-ACP methyl ester carboxylesterase